MNKYIYSILLLTSCASLDLGYFNLAKEAFARNSIAVTDEFKKDLKYSFILLTQDGNQAVYILSKSINGIDTWVGPQFQKVWTFKGLILKTSGLEQDFSLHTEDWLSITNKYPNSSFKSKISLTNPNLVMSPVAMELKSLSSSIHGCHQEAIYNINLSNLKNSWSATFCLDARGRAIRSQQKLNPLGKTLDIEFYYQY
jgi:hypothetical protein